MCRCSLCFALSRSSVCFASKTMMIHGRRCADALKEIKQCRVFPGRTHGLQASGVHDSRLLNARVIGEMRVL